MVVAGDYVVLVVVFSIQASGGVLSPRDRVPVSQFCHVQEPTVYSFRWITLHFSDTSPVFCQLINDTLYLFYVHVTVHHNKFLYNKTN